MNWTTHYTIYLLILSIIILIVTVVLSYNLGVTSDDLIQQQTNYLRANARNSIIMTEKDYFSNVKRFSIVIVTHIEPMLEKTYPTISFLFFLTVTVLNVLENTPSNRLEEIVIVDDANDPPITWNPDPSRVRVVRSGLFPKQVCYFQRNVSD